jgi:uncharacterized delta-60 repeat protein
MANIVMAKFDLDGNPILSFGINGIVNDESNLSEYGNSICIQNDNKILIGSRVLKSDGQDFGLNRYNEDGSNDEDFGINGKVLTNFPNTRSAANSVLIQSNGKIILSGFAAENPNIDFAIARYNSNGDLDITFGNNGKVITNLGLEDKIVSSILDKDEKLLCTGRSVNAENESSFSMARYFTDLESKTNNKEPSENTAKIFPNPAHRNFTLSTSFSNREISFVKLFDISGKFCQILSFRNFIYKENKKLEVVIPNSMNSGIYIVQIIAKDRLITKRIILN